MYVKVFRQIFDSSIAEDYLARWVFMDLLVLATKHGEVDMTAMAIARTTGVPVEIVRNAIAKLESPDHESRNPDQEGRRIVRIDAHRSWGWKIVNYEEYREIQDEEARRAMWAEQKREQRRRNREKKMSKTLNGHSKTIADCPPVSAKVHPSEAEADSEAKEESVGVASSSRVVRDPNTYTPPRRQSFIDRKNPPFRTSGIFNSEEFKGAVKDLLRYYEEKFGRQLAGIEFNSLMNRFQQLKSPKEAIRIIERCIANGFKNPVFPDDGEYR